ncbi:hypothetical protein TKK_0002280 [Trichogramma kaykai]|uniref:SET domain-containing protein n=1 Tax=Trichogramma kaykai TaxID=54128 RepID=A0ABD2XB52_9HYME
MNFRTLSNLDDLAKSLIVKHFGNYSLRLMSHKKLNFMVTVDNESKKAIERFLKTENTEQAISDLMDIVNTYKLTYFYSITKKTTIQYYFKLYLRFFHPDSLVRLVTCTEYSQDNFDGVAVLAKKNIKASTVITELFGLHQNLTKEEENDIVEKQLGFSLVRTSRSRNTKLLLGSIAFVNHSCDANSQYKYKSNHVIVLQTIRDVLDNEELTVFYGDGYFGINNEDCECKVCKKKKQCKLPKLPEIRLSSHDNQTVQKGIKNNSSCVKPEAANGLEISTTTVPLKNINIALDEDASKFQTNDKHEACSPIRNAIEAMNDNVQGIENDSTALLKNLDYKNKTSTTTVQETENDLTAILEDFNQNETSVNTGQIRNSILVPELNDSKSEFDNEHETSSSKRCSIEEINNVQKIGIENDSSSVKPEASNGLETSTTTVPLKNINIVPDEDASKFQTNDKHEACSPIRNAIEAMNDNVKGIGIENDSSYMMSKASNDLETSTTTMTLKNINVESEVDAIRFENHAKQQACSPERDSIKEINGNVQKIGIENDSSSVKPEASNGLETSTTTVPLKNINIVPDEDASKFQTNDKHEACSPIRNAIEAMNDNVQGIDLEDDSVQTTIFPSQQVMSSKNINNSCDAANLYEPINIGSQTPECSNIVVDEANYNIYEGEKTHVSNGTSIKEKPIIKCMAKGIFLKKPEKKLKRNNLKKSYKNDDDLSNSDEEPRESESEYDPSDSEYDSSDSEKDSLWSCEESDCIVDDDDDVEVEKIRDSNGGEEIEKLPDQSTIRSAYNNFDLSDFDADKFSGHSSLVESNSDTAQLSDNSNKNDSTFKLNDTEKREYQKLCESKEKNDFSVFKVPPAKTTADTNVIAPSSENLVVPCSVSKEDMIEKEKKCPICDKDFLFLKMHIKRAHINHEDADRFL